MVIADHNRNKIRSTSATELKEDATKRERDCDSPRPRTRSFENNAAPMPFFVMDWLEHVDSRDLELAQEMLKTPQKVSTDIAPKDQTNTISPLRQMLFPSSSGSLTVPSVSGASQSPFRKRSVAIGNAWNAKGLHKAKRSDWEKALACWENALEIRSQVLGDSHADVANTCNNIGIALGKLKRFEEGSKYLHRALEIRTAHYGKQHVEVAATLHNIGNLYHQSGQLDLAIQCFYESKSLQEAILGDDHVQVARACVAIGHCHFQADDFYQARAAYSEAIEVFYRAGLSKDHVEVQATLLDLKDSDRTIGGGAP